MPYTKQQTFFFFGIVVIYSLAIFIQANLLLNWDVSWLMHASRRLLAGGTYSKDFFEVNPPMIMYLYIPPVLLNKFFSTNIVLALRIYIFLLASFSLSICYLLVKKIFIDKNKWTAHLFLLTIAACFLILPIYEFGQREHLLIMLTMPYFLTVTYRLQGQMINHYAAISIGLFAGLAFALKPFFLIPLAFVEIYYVSHTKNLLAWARAEIFAIIFVLSTYTLSIFIFQPDYLFISAPLFMRIYYSGFSLPLYLVVLYYPISFCLAALLFAAIQYKKHQKQPLFSILTLALIGFLLVFLIPHTIWYYHILPAYFFAILLFTWLVISFISQVTNKKELSFVILLSLFIFYFPFHYSYYLYQISTDYKDKYNKLIVFMKKHAEHQSVYFFATIASSTFPAVDYAHASAASRFAYLGWIPGMLYLTELYKNSDRLQQLTQDKNFIIDMIADDLNTKKPDLVFIDVSHPKPYLDNFDFDYLKYFTINHRFRQAWQAYHLLTTLKEEGFYQYAVYQRTTFAPYPAPQLTYRVKYSSPSHRVEHD